MSRANALATFPGKRVEARVGFLRTGLALSGISRILFPLSRDAIIYLTRFPECPALYCRVRLLPEGVFPLSREKRAGNFSLCFVLHHMGFFVRLRLREDPVGSYPAFSPLPSTISCQCQISCQLSVAS